MPSAGRKTVELATCVDTALAALEVAGVEIVDCELPETKEASNSMGSIGETDLRV